jgi:lipocalin
MMNTLLSIHMAHAVPDFAPYRFSGEWYETLSIKKPETGIPPCVDTASLFEYDPENDYFDAIMQCRYYNKSIHRIKSILSCAPPTKAKTPSVATCSLRFPTAPFVPPVTYTILDTDYDSYSIIESVPGSYIQVLSRQPHPGMTFISQKRERLRLWGYDPDEAHISPVTIDKQTLT